MPTEYDEMGNPRHRPFNPQVHAEDAEKLADIDAMSEAAVYKLQQDELRQTNQFMSDSWAEALKEAGLTAEEYRQLAVQDVAGAQALVREGMGKLTKTVAARKGQTRNPQTGQFVSSQQPGPVQPAQAAPTQTATEINDELRSGKINSDQALEKKVAGLDLIGRGFV